MGKGWVGRRAVAGALGLLLSASASAEFTAGAEVGIGHTDNIERSPIETEETIGVLGLDLTWLESTRRLDADVTADLSYFEYLDDTFESEVVGTADGTLSLGIIPERFMWVVQEAFGQATSDPFSPVTPETREYINFLSTGPDLVVRFGAASGLTLFGRYSITSYENSPLDSSRTSAGAALFRDISSQSTVSLNAVTEQVELDDEPESNYDRDNAFLTYELDAARTDITLQLGYTWLKPRFGPEDGGPLFTLSLTRELSASSSLNLSLERQFTDASEALQSSLGSAGGPTDVTAAGDPFENRSAAAYWIFQRNRTGFTLGASWGEELYEQNTLFNRTRYSYEASISRQMGRNLELMLGASLEDDDFENLGLQSEELDLMGRLSWRFGRNMGVALQFSRSDRSSTEPTDEYVENRAYLMFTFGDARPTGGF